MFLLSQILLSTRNEIIATILCYLESLGFPPPKQFHCPPPHTLPSQMPRLHCPSHRRKNEPIRRLKNISKVLLKEPLQEGVGFLRWGNRIQIENPLGNSSFRCLFPLWLISVGEADEAQFPCLRHHIPTIFRSECSRLQHTGIFSETRPQGSCSLCLATQFPMTSLSAILTFHGPNILWKIYSPPPTESGVTGVKETVLWISCLPQLFVRTWKWWMGEHPHSGHYRCCAPWIKSHCVLLPISGFVCGPIV